MRLSKKISKLLRKRAKWKALDPKTRNLCERLFVSALYCLAVTLSCVVAVLSEVPHIEIFQMLGLSAAMVFTALVFLSLSVNLAGVIISRAERYQRSNPTQQKRMKNFLFSRSITVRAVSYRAGHVRSHRRASRSAFSNAASENSSDGESDSGDPPGPSYSVTPFHTFYRKPNNFTFPWSFLSGPGCWRMLFCPAPAGRGWGE